MRRRDDGDGQPVKAVMLSIIALALLCETGCVQQATPTLVASVTPYPTRTPTLVVTVTPFPEETRTATVTPYVTLTGTSPSSGPATVTPTPRPLELPACQIFDSQGVGTARRAEWFLVGAAGLRTTQPAPTPTAPIATPQPRTASAPIGPENAYLVEPLVVIFPGARLNDLIFQDADAMLSVGYVDRISRWDVETGKEAGSYHDGREDAGALSIAISRDGALIATGGSAWDNGVRVVEVETGTARTLGAHENIVVSVAFNASGTLLASGDGGNQVRIWDVSSGALVATLEGDAPGLQERFSSLFWVDDETLIAAGAMAVYRWNVESRELLTRLAIPEEVDFIVEATFGQRANRLAAAAQDDAVYVWTGASGEWVTWPAPPAGGVSSVAFSPDGGLLAAGTFGGQMLLWDAQSARLLLSCSGPADAIVAVGFSPDGRYISAVGWDSTIWLWGVP